MTSGTTATASLGVLLRPVRWWALGANVRGPVYLNTSGTVEATAPAALPMKIDPAPVTFSTNLPWVVRVGTRFILAKREDLETADVEVDATWENWSAAQGDGPKVNIPNLSLFSDIHPTIVHHYHDTFSVRLGASYNVALPAGTLALRIGGYFDSSATDPKDTRLDFDTLAKLAGTVGIGYSVRGFTVNFAYAYVHEFDRTVTDGQLRPVNGAQHGDPVDDMGNPLPAVNNGRYHGETHILSFGLTLRFDELAGRKHKPRWPDESSAIATPARPRVVVEGAHDEALEPSTAASSPDAAIEEATDGASSMKFAPDPVRRKKTAKAKKHTKRQARRSW
jgi:long-subunit fatty acid transport protein